MAGYGGQMVALDVLTPAENQSQLAETSLKQSQADYDKQALPLRIQTLKSQLQTYDLSNTKSALDLQVQRQRTQNEVTGLQQGLMANAFATFDPDAPDAASRWDEMVDKLAEDGAPQASQFKGRYSPAMAKKWALAYAANSPGAASSEVAGGGNSAQSGLAGVDGNFAGVSNGAQATDYDKLFANAPPQKIQAALQNVSAHMAAVRRVEQSANPLQTLQQEAQALGYSQLQVAGIQPSDVPNLLAKIKATYGPLENYLTARAGRTGAGVPQPQIAAELKDVGGNLMAIDTSNPADPKAKVIAEGAGKYQPYTDAQGNTWTFNAKSGDFEQAANGPKGLQRPGGVGGRGGSVYEQKRAAWLEVHPGDNSGALEYAGGKSGKVMTPGEIERTAISQATKDYTAISLTGAPSGPDGKPVDPQTWINNRAREIAGTLTVANAQPAAAPASAPAGQRPAQMTAAQKAAITRYKGSQAEAGTQGSPFVPTSEAQYNGLPKGAFYIGTDGQLRRKS